MNVGGQVIPSSKVFELFSLIKIGRIKNWAEVHAFYDECQASYTDYKARYALYLLEQLYSRECESFDREVYADITNDVAYVSMNMLESSITSREKDYTDFFRSITFRNKRERDTVLGSFEDNSFLKHLRYSTDEFNGVLEKIFRKLR